MSEDNWQYIAWIKRAKNRMKVFLALNKPSMPSEIVLNAYGKRSDIHFTFVSRALRELKDKGLVKVKNPSEKTGRIYELTTLGKIIKSDASFKTK